MNETKSYEILIFDYIKIPNIAMASQTSIEIFILVDCHCTNITILWNFGAVFCETHGMVIYFVAGLKKIFACMECLMAMMALTWLTLQLSGCQQNYCLVSLEIKRTQKRSRRYYMT